ncbi:hypothetical protein QUB19_20310 [Microcoleus sp. B4-C5]|uniref:hypothetical protein n=1 Tax=unclassified Microcoleus TaxID=2642155 RepID=UPI002FCEFD4F
MKSKSVTQISGIPGQLVGAVPVRTSGTGTLKIVGDTLQRNFIAFLGKMRYNVTDTHSGG